MSDAKHPISIFGKRLREARLKAGIPQDKLGVMIGLDESCSSARMSRYENGVHSPSYGTVERVANVLGLPPAYFYCADDSMAELVNEFFHASGENKSELVNYARELNAGLNANTCQSKTHKP
jgi:transcriptional regulator with XRE-family HTH domain